VPSYRQSKRPGAASPTRKGSLHGFDQEFPFVAASDEQPGVAIAIAEGFASAFWSSRLFGPQWLQGETCLGWLSCGAAVGGAVASLPRTACFASSVDGRARKNGAACPGATPGLPAITERRATAALPSQTFAFNDRCFLRPNV
jgi:hypothetical protein